MRLCRFPYDISALARVVFLIYSLKDELISKTCHLRHERRTDEHFAYLQIAQCEGVSFLETLPHTHLMRLYKNGYETDESGHRDHAEEGCVIGQVKCSCSTEHVDCRLQKKA